MITNKKDFKFYVQQDCLRNIGKERISMIMLAIHCFYGNDSYRAYKYLRALRKYEYALNCSQGVWGRLHMLIAKICWHRLGAKYNVNINPNVVGYGFRIPHLVGGVIINCKSVGSGCTANAGVVVGDNDRGEMAVIGNGVDLSVGCKVIGGVSIGDNVIVAPNTVVVKDVPSNVVVTGIPARILKYRD